MIGGRDGGEAFAAATFVAWRWERWKDRMSFWRSRRHLCSWRLWWRRVAKPVKLGIIVESSIFVVTRLVR